MDQEWINSHGLYSAEWMQCFFFSWGGGGEEEAWNCVHFVHSCTYVPSAAPKHECVAQNMTRMRFKHGMIAHQTVEV